MNYEQKIKSINQSVVMTRRRITLNFFLFLKVLLFIDPTIIANASKLW